jgi:hypothetical protein
MRGSLKFLPKTLAAIRESHSWSERLRSPAESSSWEAKFLSKNGDKDIFRQKEAERIMQLVGCTTGKIKGSSTEQ